MEMRDLVERITRDVMEALKEKKGSTSAEGTASASRRRAIFILASPTGREAGELAGMKERGWDLCLVVPGKGRERLGPGAEAFVAEIITLREEMDFDALIGRVDSVIFRVGELHHLSRLANLIDDSPDVRLVFRALTLGKEVFLHDALGPLNPGIQKRVDSLFQAIRDLGIKIETIKTSGSMAQIRKDEDGGQKTCQAVMDECIGCGMCVSAVADKVDAVVKAGADRVSGVPGISEAGRKIGNLIDHTLLKPDTTREQIVHLCEEAKTYSFASVCINPAYVKLASECLRGSPVKVCTVIGFPLGATTIVTKAMETRDAIANGADEIDMVINVGALKTRNYDLVKRDIEAVVEAAAGHVVKVIIEAALLTDEEKMKACELARDAGADYVKTSTGFGPGGATVHDVALMRQTVGKYMGIKASGGIRDLETAQRMIEAGATRIGASASVAIVKGKAAGKEKY